MQAQLMGGLGLGFAQTPGKAGEEAKLFDALWDVGLLDEIPWETEDLLCQMLLLYKISRICFIY